MTMANFYPIFLIITIFQSTTCNSDPESMLAYCPLMDFKANLLNFNDKRFSVPQGNARVLTECSLACFQDYLCKGFSFNPSGQNCSLHYSVPASIYNTVAVDGIATPLTFMPEDFSLYPYRYPHPCLFPFTLSGTLYNDSCAKVGMGYTKCDFLVCPVLTGELATIRRCSIPDNSSQSHFKTIYMSCPKIMGEVFALETTTRTWILVQHKRYNTFYSNSPSTSQGSNPDWSDYKKGFGTIDDNYWIGNDWLNGLTTSSCTQSPINASINYRLRIELGDQNGRWYSAEYKNFKVGTESEQYKLNISGFDESMSDLADGFSLSDQSLPANDQSGQSNPKISTPPWYYLNCTQPCKIIPFSTNDRRINSINSNCTLLSGWWYNNTQLNCQSSNYGNLNVQKSVWPNKRGVEPLHVYPIETRMYISKN